MTDVIEICSVKITIGNESIYVQGICRPNDKAEVPEFDVILNDVLFRFDAKDFVFIVGDLNLDTISPSNHVFDSVNNLISHSFVPFINLPTRCTACLDHIWSNNILQ